jgi:hypothetical protein
MIVSDESKLMHRPTLIIYALFLVHKYKGEPLLCMHLHSF